MKNKKLINWLCLSGIIALIFYHLHGVIGATYYSGYNWLMQAMSDLTAVDAPSYVIASSYTTIYSIFACLCCTLVSILVKNENKLLKLGVYIFCIMNFVSAIGYALFPLSSSGFDGSFQTIMHVYVVTALVVLLSIISLILIGFGSFKGKYKALGILSITALLFMFVGAIGSRIVPKEYFGLFERFSTYSVVIFNAILGLYGFRVFNIKE